MDASTEMLRRARERLPAVTFALGDLQRLPLASGSVDFVVSGLALSHVDPLEPVLAEFARVLRPAGHLVISDVHAELVFRGSVVRAVGTDQQPQLAATYRHTVGDFLRAALGAGFAVRGFDEQAHPESAVAPVPEPTQDIGTWQEWPWTLLGMVPEASRAAWDQPAVVLWHLQLG